jgi:low temperature requirement protein LtrA
MRAYRVVEMGIERSYWDFYLGSGWTITALLVASAGVMWFLAPLAHKSRREVRPVIGALALGFAAVTGISLLYFVTAPIVVAAAITACLAAAAFAARDGAQA